MFEVTWRHSSEFAGLIPKGSSNTVWSGRTKEFPKNEFTEDSLTERIDQVLYMGGTDISVVEYTSKETGIAYAVQFSYREDAAASLEGWNKLIWGKCFDFEDFGIRAMHPKEKQPMREGLNAFVAALPSSGVDTTQHDVELELGKEAADILTGVATDKTPDKRTLLTLAEEHGDNPPYKAPSVVAAEATFQVYETLSVTSSHRDAASDIASEIRIRSLEDMGDDQSNQIQVLTRVIEKLEKRTSELEEENKMLRTTMNSMAADLSTILGRLGTPIQVLPQHPIGQVASSSTAPPLPETSRIQPAQAGASVTQRKKKAGKR